MIHIWLLGVSLYSYPEIYIYLGMNIDTVSFYD
jgi:DNA-binding CsgD family transcriptional regulator